MFLEHRSRVFQGMFHNNPDYTWWYGYSEMQRALTDIKHMAEEMRRVRTSAGAKPAAEKAVPGKKAK
jgi:hypothetical protein